MTDHATWDRVLGYCWAEREMMIFLRDHRPAMYDGPYDATDDFDLADPAVAALLAGPAVEVTWLGITDAPAAAG